MSGLKIILASASPTRAELLMGVGLDFDVEPAVVDEVALREHLMGEGAPLSEIAVLLAEVKARAVSRAHPDALVIGADQILLLGHEVFEKPSDTSAARETLQRLRGKTHELISAVALVHEGDTVWQGSEAARLTMREFSHEFLEDYLSAEDEAVLGSVGAYRLEGRGAQLFQKVEGDYFTILGLPLLQLLAVLREAGIIPS
jgi:septum formation protein